MALDSIVFSDEIIQGYLDFTALDSSGEPITDSDGVPVSGSGDFAQVFTDATEQHSLTGAVPGAVHGSQDTSIVYSYMSGLTQPGATVPNFATMLANYWSTVLIVNGAPAHGGVSVVSVVNDAASKVSLFEQAVNSALTQSESKPWFETLATNIESIALPGVTWTVTELMPNGSTQDFLEVVS